MDLGAIRTQAACRGYLVRRSMKVLRMLQYDEEIAHAANAIQSKARQRHFSKRKKLARLKKRHKLALEIQRVFRGFCDRRWCTLLQETFIRMNLEQDCSIHVQSLARTYLSKRIVQTKRMEKSSILIQSQFRGHKFRLEKDRKEETTKKEYASIQLQRINRGKMARQKARNLRNNIKIQNENNAAISIQKNHRKKMAKEQTKLLRQKYDEENKIQEFQKSKENNAAISLQSQIRGKQDRHRYNQIKLENKAATTVQSTQRRRLAHRNVQQKREEKRKKLDEQITPVKRKSKRRH